MFTKDEMKGIMMFATPVIQTGKDEKLKVGYYTRVSVVIRGENNFIQAIMRTLKQYEIPCEVKIKESKARPKPILTIKGRNHLRRLLNEFILTDSGVILSSHGKWYNFALICDLVEKRHHLTDYGFMQIVNLTSSSTNDGVIKND